MTAPTHRRLLDEEVVIERRHFVALIAEVMEMDTLAWPGEGAKAQVGRLVVARRIAFARWCARNGEIGEADESHIGARDAAQVVRERAGFGQMVGVDDV